jgi:uncharacterized RDD family membrane protein YckC
MAPIGIGLDLSAGRGIEELAIMDPHPEIKSALKSEWESKPVVVPPPDLPKPPAPPPSLPPASAAFPDAAVKVKIRSAQDPGERESSDDTLASFNTRATAALLDVVVALGIAIGLAVLLPGFADRLAWLTGFAYLVTRDSLPFLGGQSVGKKAMKLRVVTLDGKSLIGNWETALIRNGVLVIPLFAFVELFILLTREDTPERGRRLGDEWAKTRVIVEETRPDADSP